MFDWKISKTKETIKKQQERRNSYKNNVNDFGFEGFVQDTNWQNDVWWQSSVNKVGMFVEMWWSRKLQVTTSITLLSNSLRNYTVKFCKLSFPSPVGALWMFTGKK